MYRYRCPSCKGRIDLKTLYDRRYLLNCSSCQIATIITSTDGDDEAYLKFLEDYDRGLIKQNVDLMSLLEKEGILRSEDSVRKMVAETGMRFDELPNIFRDALLSRLDYLVSLHLTGAQEPKYGAEIDTFDLDDNIVTALGKNGITKLYQFQIEAIEKIFLGKNIVIAAPTGSGKTEAFAIPIIQLVAKTGKQKDGFRMDRGKVRALFIYPTKALGRDQLPKLNKIGDAVGIRIGVFDGDTPSPERRRLLDDPPSIVITNFDVLHHHLMHRTNFSRLLSGVNYIVVDEVHVYKGTFGSNVHFILKRLQRLTGNFQIVAASATIKNPKEFCEALFGSSFSVVNEIEGKHGRMYFAILFPTLRSHRSLVIDLMRSLTSSNYRPIVFSSSHLGAELTAFYGRRNGVDVEVHRAGLLPTHRKRVEEMFKRGLLKAISATPTLELGIDIGEVNAIVSDLVPITRLIQRTGRAARRGQEGLAFLVLRENDPISQYYKNNPQHYLEDIEHGYVDSTNPVIAEVQLLAAALDRPIRKREFQRYHKELDSLISKKLLKENKDWLLPDYREVLRILNQHDIRGCGENVSIRLGERKIGERSMPQALDELHRGAVYFLGGSRYRSLDLVAERGRGTAKVEKLTPNYPYFTKSLVEEWPTIHDELERRMVFNVEVIRCSLAIIKKVIGYVNIELGSNVSRGQKILLEEPVSYCFNTKGFVLMAPIPELFLNRQQNNVTDILTTSSFHASEHVIIEGSNMITGGAGADMGGISLGSSGLIFIYDGSPGGNGASKILYDRLEDSFHRGFKILNECSCTSESGCPRCTYSYKCGNNNEYLNKKGAIAIFKMILDGAKTTVTEPIPGERTFV